tara:strand:+ start:82 stop:657 length:576 start_codon:yes stop_codon:yes gene_type:complete
MSHDLMVIDQLKSDPSFAVEFLLDNNPSEIQAHLSGLNLLTGFPQESTRQSLLADIYSIDDAGTIKEVLAVPYINEKENYTGGYEQQLSVEGSAVGGDQKGLTFGMVLVNGIASIGNSITNYLISNNEVEITELNAEALDAQIEAERQRVLAEEARMNRAKIFGFPPSLFLALIGSVTIISVFAMIALRKK